MLQHTIPEGGQGPIVIIKLLVQALSVHVMNVLCSPDVHLIVSHIYHQFSYYPKYHIMAYVCCFCLIT